MQSNEPQHSNGDHLGSDRAVDRCSSGKLAVDAVGDMQLVEQGWANGDQLFSGDKVRLERDPSVSRDCSTGCGGDEIVSLSSMDISVADVDGVEDVSLPDALRGEYRGIWYDVVTRTFCVAISGE